VLGFFGSKPEALAHASRLSAHDKGLEIRIAPAGDFRVMMSTPNNDQTREREVKKHETLLARHALSRKQAFQETMDNAAGRKMGTLKFRPEDQIAELNANAKHPAQLERTEPEQGLKEPTPENSALKTRTEPKDVLKEPKEPSKVPSAIPPQFEVRMQKFAAIAIIPDYEHCEALSEKVKQCMDGKSEVPKASGAEPAVAFLKAAETEAEMAKWIAENSMRDVDLACVTMYEWIKVVRISSDNVTRRYREPQLEKLHSNKAFQAAEAKKLHGSAKVIEIVA
jgi:hypothetical protein